MKHTFTLLLSAFLLRMELPAQAFGELDINDVRVRFHAHGLIGNDPLTATAAFEVPQGDSTNALYSAGLWVGGLSLDYQLHLAAMQYEANGASDYYTGPLTNDGTATTDAVMMDAYDHVWVATKAEVDLHLAYFTCLSDPNCDLATEFPNGYTIPPSFFEWPAINTEPGYDHYQAPFIDWNNDGDYTPGSGDAPCILGDQALYFVFNDNGGPHPHSDGLPIGMEVQAMAFAYDSADPALQQTVFVHYHIINRSTQTLVESRIGMFNDFDLGCGADDFVGTDAARNLTYVYNGDEVDESCSGVQGYGAQPPAFGMVLLKGPFRDYNMADEEDPNALPSWNGTDFNDGVIDNEKFGLSAAIHMYGQGDTCCTDPSFTWHYYKYLQGIWKDSAPLSYGATGYSTDPNALACSFAFPGDSDPVGAGTGGVPQPAWSESGVNALDRRTVCSAGPFTLEPGMHEDLLLAYVFARADAGGAAASVSALQARVDLVTQFAQTLPLWDNAREVFQGGCGGVVPAGVVEHTAPVLLLFPVPASTYVQVDAQPGLAGATLRIRDAAGRAVSAHRLVQGLNTIDIASLAVGIYTCEAHTAKAVFTGRLIKQ